MAASATKHLTGEPSTKTKTALELFAGEIAGKETAAAPT